MAIQMRVKTRVAAIPPLALIQAAARLNRRSEAS